MRPNYVAKLLDKINMTFEPTPLAQKHGLHEVVGSLVGVSLPNNSREFPLIDTHNT